MKRTSLLGAVICGVLAVSDASAQVSAGASLFEKGKTRATITGGYGQAFNNGYFILGGGVGYFLFRGFEVGVDAEAWMGDDPQIQKVTPQIRYVFNALGSVYPYAGLFYRRIFYSDLDDTDSTGLRAGAYAPVANNVYIGGGIVVERMFDCDERVYDDCTLTYPEFGISFVF